MMTRKDYIETANNLLAYEDVIEDVVYLDLVTAFAIQFANDNPNFNRSKFFQACGVGQYA